MQDKTKNFIEKAKKLHGNTYDYSLVDYVHCQRKVKIICKLHGVFEQTPNTHLKPCGCNLCGNISIKQKQTRTQDEFLIEAKKVHDDTYDYSGAKYINDRTKLSIICKKHGQFMQTPANHLNGAGCRKCFFERNANSKRSSKEQFVTKAKETHGDRYDYSKVVYINSISKVEIICKEHGSFWQKANNHIFNRGCPNCIKTGYSTNKSGYLYLMVCNNITKIGITNLTPEWRLKDISRSYGKKFEVVEELLFENGKIPDDVETVILQYLRKNYAQPSEKFEGSTECFLDVDLEDLKIKIQEEIYKWQSTQQQTLEK